MYNKHFSTQHLVKDCLRETDVKTLLVQDHLKVLKMDHFCSSSEAAKPCPTTQLPHRDPAPPSAAQL